MADLEQQLSGLTGDARILKEAKIRFRQCENWEAKARVNYKNDVRFANGDSTNNYQWDSTVLNSRLGVQKPCLTMNKVRVHDNIIVNDAKQNKPGVQIRPTGGDATYEAAQVFQNIIRRIEYKSSAENVYDKATETQVYGGIGYWTIQTYYEDENSFDQDIRIDPVNDPMTIYLDPDIKMVDGSDARFGFEFSDKPKDLFHAEHPNYKDIASIPNLSMNDIPDNWITEDHIRVAKYYRKLTKADKLVSFVDPQTGENIVAKWSDLSKEGKAVYNSMKGVEGTQERDIVDDTIEWFLLAGDKIVDRGIWAGKYIPIVRVIGIETIIDGELDRKGHTRWLIDAQRMYNYATSNAVEFMANQTKTPWLAPAEGIENREEQWNAANIQNQSVLTYNALNEDGTPIPPPQRIQPPVMSPAYVKEMELSENQMMMVSGQYQAQMGENENAKSGVAIDARQRQGDRATYHFIDNLAIAIRFTGKILIDLIPKIYDTERVLRIEGIDGKRANVKIDPNAQQALENIPPEPGFSQQPQDADSEVVQMIFNPTVGKYDVQSDVGPSFATKRQAAFAAMTDLAKADKNFMTIAGDLYFKAADFPEALALSERYNKMIPPNIKGDAPDPQVEAAMNQAAQKIEQMQQIIANQAKALADKDKEIDIRAYEAESKRLTAFGNSGPAVAVEQIQPVLLQLLKQMGIQAAPTGDDAMNLADQIEMAPPPKNPVEPREAVQ